MTQSAGAEVGDPYPDTGHGDALRPWARPRGDRPATLLSMLVNGDLAGGVRLIDGDCRYTRAEAVAAVAGHVDRLRRHGVERGQRVLALFDHDLDGVFFLAAASALGLRLLMPYNLRAAALAEWRSIVRSAQPDVVVVLKRDRTGGDALREIGARVLDLPRDRDAPGVAADVADLVRLADAAPVENFLVLFTSGTTGSPKAVSVSEEVVCRRVASVSARLGFDADARVFMSGLLNNTTGVIFSFGALLHDAVLVFPENREIATWPAQVAAHRATHIMLRPVAMKRFVDSASSVDLSGLRVVAYGAAAMPRAVLERGRALMPCDWVQGYGLSETYGPFCWLDEAAHRERHSRPGAYRVGRPDDTVEIRIDPIEGHPAGVGEVLVRGGAVMEGYYDVTTDTLDPPGEWLRTGDLGEWSADGDLLLKGRISGSVMSADGHRVYPEEVEAVLAELPGVDEVVLVGAGGPDTLVERPVVCLWGPICRQEPAGIRRAVVDALERALSPEKWPDSVYPASAPFPKSDNDKVMRGRVARRIDHHAVIPL